LELNKTKYIFYALNFLAVYWKMRIIWRFIGRFSYFTGKILLGKLQFFPRGI